MLLRGNVTAAALTLFAAVVVNSWLIPDRLIAGLSAAMAAGLLLLSYAGRDVVRPIVSGGSLAILGLGLTLMYLLGVTQDHALDQALNAAVLLPILAYACLIGSGRGWLISISVGAFALLGLSYAVHGTEHDRGLVVLAYGSLYTIGAITVSTLFLAAHRRVLDFAEDAAGKAQRRGEELELAQARMRAFLDAIPSPIYAKDRDLRYIDCNTAFCDFVGLPRERIIGSGVRDILPAAAAEAFHNHDLALLRAGGVQSYETDAVTAAGATRPAVFHKAVVAGADGQAVGLVGTIIDLTDLRSMQSRLMQAEKLEALGRLAGGVAHDMNNQLTGVIGYAELLASRLPEGQDRDDARSIATAAMRAANLPRQLLAYARKGNYLAVPVELHALIDEMHAMLVRSIGPGIVIERDLAAPRSTIVGDPGQLQSMLLNLALNARDAMPDGGRLSFATRAVSLPSPQACPAADGLPAGTFLHLEVSDTGRGMDAEVQRHVFEPFFTTKSGAGTGLGLASVYGTVHNHHGGICVHSQPGEGTRFSILLPLTDTARPAAPTAATATTGLRRRLLLVDDDDIVRTVLLAQLTQLGHDVVGCGDGAAAVALLQHGERFDGAVIDLLMPGMSGVETFHALLRLQPGLGVVIASGHHDAQEAQRLLDAGALAFLTKPVSLAQLAAAVGDARSKP